MSLLPVLFVILFCLLYVDVYSQQCRDRVLSPFASTSIWNMPIGSNAEFIASNIFDGSDKFPLPTHFHGDEDIFFAVTNKDELYPWYNQGHWGKPDTYEAYCNITGNYIGDILFPSNTTINNFGHNNAAGILQPDNITLFQMQPLYHCNISGPIFALIGCFEHQNVSILGDGIYGCHGGSGLSSVGGTIRDFEIIGNENNLQTISHSLKLEFNGTIYYYNATQDNSSCYRWPASQCFGCDRNLYSGNNPFFQPGTLLAVSSNITLDLDTIPAKKILFALQNYGAYIVDDTGNENRGTLCVEHGLQDSFMEYYGYSFETSPGHIFYNDLLKIFQKLQIVKNSDASHIGGGGQPIIPLSPPICQ